MSKLRKAILSSNFLAIVISGGKTDEWSQCYLLLWTPKQQCRLPAIPLPYPFYDWFGHTINWIDNTELVACTSLGVDSVGSSKCVQFSNGELKNQIQLQGRSFHTSAVIGNYVLLEGGYDLDRSSTNITYSSTIYVDAKGNDTFEGPPMTRGRAMHCSVQVDSSTIVLTGGVSSNINESISSVVQYSQVAVGNSPTSTKLPDLNRARANHACGCFKLPNGKNFEKV